MGVTKTLGADGSWGYSFCKCRPGGIAFLRRPSRGGRGAGKAKGAPAAREAELKPQRSRLVPSPQGGAWARGRAWAGRAGRDRTATTAHIERRTPTPCHVDSKHEEPASDVAPLNAPPPPARRDPEPDPRPAPPPAPAGMRDRGASSRSRSEKPVDGRCCALGTARCNLK